MSDSKHCDVCKKVIAKKDVRLCLRVHAQWWKPFMWNHEWDICEKCTDRMVAYVRKAGHE